MAVGESKQSIKSIYDFYISKGYIIFNIKLNFDKDGNKLKPQRGDMPDGWNQITKSQPCNGENFGLLTEQSGLTVIDVDIKNGKNGLQYLKDRGIDLDDYDTIKVSTPSGGLHYYFKYDPKFQHCTRDYGIDVPKMIYTGLRYEIINDADEMDYPPQELYDLLYKNENKKQEKKNRNENKNKNEFVDLDFDCINQKYYELINLLPDKYFNDFRCWMKPCYALYNAIDCPKDQGLNTFCRLLSERSSGYDEKEAIRVWNLNETQIPDTPITFGSICMIAGGTNPEKYNDWKNKYQPKVDLKPIVVGTSTSAKNYFEEDDYYYNDFIAELDKVIFENSNEAYEFLRDNLPRVIARVDDTIIRKVNQNEFYVMSNMKALSWNNQFVHIADVKKPITLQKIYNLSKGNYPYFNELLCNFDYRRENPKAFYASRPFKAKLLESYDKEVIEELLIFIKEITCNNDDVLYTYFMQFLSFMAKFPHLKSRKAVQLIGLPRTGKGRITDFLTKWVFGENSCEPNIEGFGKLLDTNNYRLLGKKLVIVNETSQTKEKYRAVFDELKAFITENDMSLKKLYCDTIRVKQYCEIISVSNHNFSLLLEDKDDRWLVLQVNDKYINNQEYLIEFYKRIANENVANHFYTYLHTILDSPEKFWYQKVPKSELKATIQHTSKDSVHLYSEFLNTENKEHIKTTKPCQPSADSIYIKPDENNLVQASEFYTKYKIWCSTFNEKPKAMRFFSPLIQQYGIKKIEGSKANYYILP